MNRPSVQLGELLTRGQMTVLDVVPSAALRGRRLFLGPSGSGSATFAVALAEATATQPLDCEETLLRGLPGKLRPELSGTLPRVVQRIEVDPATVGLLVTAVFGLRPGHTNERLRRPDRLLAAVDTWLDGVWHDTAGPCVPIDLGSRGTAVLLDGYAGSVPLGPAAEAMDLARTELSQFEVQATLSHGCLCPRHAKASDDVVTGVDDWGRGQMAADPLRDLGGFAVAVAGGRLAEVLAGRSRFAGMVRAFVESGLERAAMPARLWRDVLILAQVELAVRGLERGERVAISDLVRAVQVMPRRKRGKGRLT